VSRKEAVGKVQSNLIFSSYDKNRFQNAIDLNKLLDLNENIDRRKVD